jgi:hypothetical protein
MRILLLAFENDSYAIGSIAKQLEERGHVTCIANGDHWSFVYDESVRNLYRSLSLTRTYNLEDEFRKFQTRSTYIADRQYLRSFEEKYCRDKNIQQLMLSDHVINAWPRYPYYTKFSHDMAYCWTEARLKWIESIFIDFKPDYVFSISNYAFLKNAVWQIAKATSVEMKTLIDSRIGNLVYFSSNFGYGDDLEQSGTQNDCSLKNPKRAAEFIQEYRNVSTKFSSYDDCYTEVVRSELTAVNVIVEMVSRPLRILLRHGIRRSSERYRGWRPHLMDCNTSIVTQFAYEWRVSLNRLRYIWKIKSPFEQAATPGARYIYFPLHTLPESSTLTTSTEYHEADLVRFLSKELPAGLTLVVKENPTMIGERPYSWYRQFRRLSNVVLLDPWVLSRRVLDGCLGVAGISGTVLFEAAMLGKPTLAFGYPEFLSCVDYSGHQATKEFLRACNNHEPSKTGNKVLQYVDYVMSNGVSLETESLRPNQTGFARDVDTISDYICRDCNLQNATARAV